MPNTLVISGNEGHGKYVPKWFANRLEKHGIPVLLARCMWPRDELYFYPDGRFHNVQKATMQWEYEDNFAWNGGTFLQGDDFIIVANGENPSEKNKKTESILGVSQGYYHDISDELGELSHISVSGKYDFFKPDFTHIDIIFGIGNRARTLFTYDHPTLLRKWAQIAEQIGYILRSVPLDEARFASIGFVEWWDYMLLDGRAKWTRRVLESVWYRVLMTHFWLEKTNRKGWSLRCMTTIAPVSWESLVIERLEDIWDTSERMNAEYSLLYTADGKRVLTEGFRNKLQIK